MKNKQGLAMVGVPQGCMVIEGCIGMASLICSRRLIWTSKAGPTYSSFLSVCSCLGCDRLLLCGLLSWCTTIHALATDRANLLPLLDLGLWALQAVGELSECSLDFTSYFYFCFDEIPNRSRQEERLILLHGVSPSWQGVALSMAAKSLPQPHLRSWHIRK